MKSFLSVMIVLCGTLFVDLSYAAEEGEAVPSFTLPTLSGSSIGSRTLLGRFTYIDFWASWCPPCRVSLPFLNDLYDEFKGRVEIVAINTDTSRADADKALQTLVPRFIVAFDTAQEAVALFNPPKMPSSYLVGPDGKVIYVHKGFTTADKEEVRSRIAHALAHKRESAL